MRKILLLLLGWIVITGGIATAQRTAVKLNPTTKTAKQIKQNVPLRKCGTMEYMAGLMAQDPSMVQAKGQLEEFTQKWIENNQEYINSSNKATITVPVVVHVVGTSTVQNAITATRVNEQINALNRDYSGQNTHSMASFATSLKANTELQFCLAQRKPDGSATTGIDYVTTTTSTYSTNDLMKTHAPAWDVTKYVNIWVCNLGSSLCGYAQFPYASQGGGINSTFGVVIHYQFFGVTGATAPYNQGGTTTHEIGHCFNLFHIWGDDGGSCSGTDYCNDTPNQADANYNQWTGVHTDACTTTSPGIMYMNFMDYSPDITYANFTPNQGARIQALFASGGPLYSMTQNNLGCVPPGGSSVPTVTTTAASNIQATSATTGGNVTADGGATVTARGVCYATTQNPTTSNTVVTSGTGTGTFTCNLTGLTSGSTYYVRAYATNSNGTAYGNQISFTAGGGTTPGCDTLHYPLTGTPALYGVSAADGGGYATGNNGYGDLAKVEYFDTYTAGSTISKVILGIGATTGTGNCTVAVWNNTGTSGQPGASPIGTQVVPISSLSTTALNEITFTTPVTINTPYYVGVILPTAAGDTVAIISNSAGEGNPCTAWELWSDNTWNDFPTAWQGGLNVTLAIFPIVCTSGSTTTIPTVTTTAASAITNTTATSGGNVTSDGGATVTARGICYATTQSPTTSNTVINGGTGTGTFTSNLTGLTANTTYYVRAFATNSEGTAYGNQISFITTGGTTTGCDTLHWPLTGTPALYGVSAADGGGYATGNNGYGDLAKVEYFDTYTAGYKIEKVILGIGATTGTGNCTVAIWNNTGTSGQPGASPIATQVVPISSLSTTALNEIAFSTPVTVTTPYYAGVILPTAAGDTVAIISNSAGEASPCTAWELWSDNTWNDFPTAWQGGLNVTLAIFPVMCSSTTGEEMILNNNEVSIYPNPASSNVYINLGKYAENDVQIHIYDALGKQILVNESISNGIVSCSLNNASSGLYFVHVNTPEGTIIKKISINK